MKTKINITLLLLFLGVFVIWFAISVLEDSSREIGDGGFLSGEPCGPPCFLGIIPNVTKENEAVRILEEKGLYKNCNFVNNESESGLRGFTCSRHLVSVTFFPETNIVGGIGFDPSQEITIDMVIAKYGEPEAVMVSSIWFTWEKQPETSMALIYNDINASVSLGTQNGNAFKLEPSTLIASIGYSKPGFPSVEEDETGKKYLSPWHGYGEYEDLINP
jgi:hypothetical protein